MFKNKKGGLASWVIDFWAYFLLLLVAVLFMFILVAAPEEKITKKITAYSADVNSNAQLVMFLGLPIEVNGMDWEMSDLVVAVVDEYNDYINVKKKSHDDWVKSDKSDKYKLLEKEFTKLVKNKVKFYVSLDIDIGFSSDKDILKVDSEGGNMVYFKTRNSEKCARLNLLDTGVRFSMCSVGIESSPTGGIQ